MCVFLVGWASFVLSGVGVEELLQVGGEGGGREASEVVADGHGLLSAVNRDGPGSHWGRVVGVLADLDGDLVGGGGDGGWGGGVFGLGLASFDAQC